MKTRKTSIYPLNIIICTVTLMLSGIVQADWQQTLESWVQIAGQKTKVLCVWCDRELSELKQELRIDVDRFDSQKKAVVHEFEQTKKLVFSHASLLQKYAAHNELFQQLKQKWQTNNEVVIELEERFRQLVKSADSYFREIHERANAIADRNLQQQLLQKINSYQGTYTKKLKQSKQGLEKILAANQKLRDLITFMEINFSLKTLDTEMGAMIQTIDQQLQSALKDMDGLKLLSDEVIDEI